ncbi:hypothetical protein F383_23680 [Gossypium arboreum]|uniref:Uncharacterized protein n=1 Tax=Gossypium arboreum TaxID=29729 RepID=A0A0B0NUN0_GOSAR|nr:hypothetical protein F383_23680 [Gossypium arboreum]
MRPGLVIPP